MTLTPAKNLNLIFKREYKMKTHIKRIDIDKPIKKKINIEIILLILFLIIIFTAPLYMYKKTELPDGTSMSMNKFTKEISVKLDSNNYYFVDKSGNVSYKDGNKKELFFIDSKGNNNLYKTLLSVFNNYWINIKRDPGKMAIAGGTNEGE